MTFLIGNCPSNLLHFVVSDQNDTTSKIISPNYKITFPPIEYSKIAYPYQLYVNGIRIPPQSVKPNGLSHLALGR